MILYHGSYMEIVEPKIIVSEKGRDFGFAFYLTPIKAQAERWAKRKAKATRMETAFVSVFEWDENPDGLSIKVFNQPDMEWLDMVLKCRSDVNYQHEYDIVEGKIADDSVGETILFVMDGIISREEALKRLRFQDINSQIAFCSAKALERLRFVKSYEVK